MVVVLAIIAMDSCDGNRPPSMPFNDVDVAFAQHVIRDNLQTIRVTSLVAERTDNEALLDLSTQISTTQSDEIETLSDLLERWNRPVAADRAEDATDSASEAIATGLEELRTASGPEFDRGYVSLILDQHRDVVDRARRVTSTGYSTPAVRLAEKITTDRAAEINRLTSVVER